MTLLLMAPEAAADKDLLRADDPVIRPMVSRDRRPFAGQPSFGPLGDSGQGSS